MENNDKLGIFSFKNIGQITEYPRVMKKKMQVINMLQGTKKCEHTFTVWKNIDRTGITKHLYKENNSQQVLFNHQGLLKPE